VAVSGDDPTLPMTSGSYDGAAMIGRFHVEGVLGQGGIGVVIAARDPELDRRVAIKLLLDGHGAHGQLDREAQAMARLAHPNVITVYEVGSHDNRRFIAMELVEGETLRAWVAARERTWREIIAMFEAAGRGLEAAHRAGLVHRDFKPENVIVGADGRPRVGDFGLVTTGDNRSFAGTPGYMAPELLDKGVADARSDQFAFAVALHEALHGQRPFPGKTVTEIGANMQAGVRTPVRSSVPAWVTAVVERGLAIDPAQRWPDMGAMLDALRRDPAWRCGASRDPRQRRILASASPIA